MQGRMAIRPYDVYFSLENSLGRIGSWVDKNGPTADLLLIHQHGHIIFARRAEGDGRERKRNLDACLGVDRCPLLRRPQFGGTACQYHPGFWIFNIRDYIQLLWNCAKVGDADGDEKGRGLKWKALGVETLKTADQTQFSGSLLPNRLIRKNDAGTNGFRRFHFINS